MVQERKANKGRHSDALVPLGVFRVSDAEAVGFSRWTLARMAARGELVRLAHGVYHHPAADVDPETINYTLATHLFGGKAVIGGRTALYHHALLDEGPSEVWVLLPHGNGLRPPPLFRLLRTSHDPLASVVDHGTFRMATAERAIIEAFAYHTKIGLAAALAAGRAALREKKVTTKSLTTAAAALGCEAVMLRHWEALTVR